MKQRRRRAIPPSQRNRVAATQLPNRCRTSPDVLASYIEAPPRGACSRVRGHFTRSASLVSRETAVIFFLFVQTKLGIYILSFSKKDGNPGRKLPLAKEKFPLSAGSATPQGHLKNGKSWKYRPVENLWIKFHLFPASRRSGCPIDPLRKQPP